jgi:putative transposase
MKNDYPIALIAETLAVSRSGYHAWASGRNQRRARADEALRPKLHAAFAASRQSYGYPRLTAELRAQGERVGKTRVARLMREEGLQGRQPGAFRPRTTDSRHDGPIAPNCLAEAGPITACDQVWQADITYLPTADGWLYLAVVIDAHSKRVLGWAFSPSLETGLVIAALLMAIRRRGGRCAPGLLLHSDRGVQYTKRTLPRRTGRPRPDRLHEPTRQLLRQRPRRGFLLHAQNRTGLPPPLRGSRARPPRRVRMDRGLLQPPPPPLFNR